MTPDQHGYVKCINCGCWRRVDQYAADLVGNGGWDGPWWCADPELCGRLRLSREIDLNFKPLVFAELSPPEGTP